VLFTQSIVIAVTAAMATMFVPASHSYAGAYPVTITHSQFSNGTGCLTLSGAGSSGQAALVFESQKYPYGSFIVMNGLIVVNIVQPLYGQNGALMFVAPAHRGNIGVGDFEDIEGGSNFDFGSVSFGAKGGC
jgi:hypothetical protein